MNSSPQEINLISCKPLAHISDIKLIRTDTTLDLSQKAEKGSYWQTYETEIDRSGSLQPVEAQFLGKRSRGRWGLSSLDRGRNQGHGSYLCRVCRLPSTSTWNISSLFLTKKHLSHLLTRSTKSALVSH
ncbi:unnamed protein product [Malus baccata var. baccata]